MELFDKKLTRKQFILSAFAMVGVFVLGGLRKVIVSGNNSSAKNNYGHHFYGGNKNA
jgi:hypothetical protein